MAKDDEVWTAKMIVLKENVEHHVEEIGVARMVGSRRDGNREEFGVYSSEFSDGNKSQASAHPLIVSFDWLDDCAGAGDHRQQRLVRGKLMQMIRLINPPPGKSVIMIPMRLL